MAEVEGGMGLAPVATMQVYICFSQSGNDTCTSLLSVCDTFNAFV